MKRQEYIGLHDLAARLGVAYYRITYAHQSGAVPAPPKIAGRWLYGPEDVDKLRAYFALKRGQRK